MNLSENDINNQYFYAPKHYKDRTYVFIRTNPAGILKLRLCFWLSKLTFSYNRRTVYLLFGYQNFPLNSNLSKATDKSAI